MSASVTLEWKNLNLVIEKREFQLSKCSVRKEEKRILDNVSGNLKSGQLVAILGPSGAGKTTLLAGISQRFRGPLTGRISVNGTEIDHRTMTNISCFVPQFDATFNTLTPNEHLYFMAELKLDRKWPKSRKYQRIEYLLRELGLCHVANNRISTLSGGERKKLDLATDLLTNPPIIFCDEPTTGLDSYNARKVIEALKYLSHTDIHNGNHPEPVVEKKTSNGGYGMEMMRKSLADSQQPAKAIICSIHQPTSEIFQCFTHIILMYAGRCVFQGSTGEAIDHFSKLGFVCPAAYNPADFYLNVLSNTTSGDQISSQSFFKRPIEMLRKSNNYTPPSSDNNDGFDPNAYKIRGPRWIGQMWLLIQRSMLTFQRSYREVLVDIAWYIIPYVIMAFLYHNATGRTQESIQDVGGAFFLITCELIFTQCYAVMNFYPERMPVLRRETNEHIYKFSAYYVAEIVNVIPICFLRSFSGLTITYFFAGFNTGPMFFFQIGFTLMIASFTATAYGLMMSSLFRISIAEIASVTDLILLSISGFYINLSSFPYIRYLSLFFFANEALSVSFWSKIDEIDCPPKYEEKCYRNGTDVLNSLSFHTHASDVQFDYAGLIVLGLIMHTIAYMFLKRNVTSVGYF